MHSDQLRYSPPPRRGPGEIQIRLFDAGAKFQDIAHIGTGILQENPAFTTPDDPDPARRFLWRLRPGQYIENDACKGLRVISDAPPVGESQPLIWQEGYGIRMPNLEVRLPQLIAGGWRDLQRTRCTLADLSKYAPIGQALAGQGTGEEQIVNPFGVPPDEVGPATLFLRAQTGPGRYGLRYQEGTEATGSRNTDFRDPVTGRLTFGAEAEQAGPVEDVFFHAFDTTDVENFKITVEPRYDAPEVTFSMPVARGMSTRLDVHLVPRQWFYFCYILAWYAIVTFYGIIYHPLPIVASWWDRPPLHPVPFGLGTYMSDVFGGIDDQGVYWKVTHSEEFLSLLQQVHDFEMTSYLMGIIWLGIETYYYRVRCFGAKERQLCAILRDPRTGATWHVWRKTPEEKDKITLVDSCFWPEEASGWGF